MTSQRNRVLQITYTGGTGGISVIIRDLVEYIQAKHARFEVEVCYISQKGVIAREVEKLGITVHCLFAKSGLDIVRILKLLDLIRNGDYDIVHLHSFTPLVRLITWLARPKKLVMTEHGGVKGEMFSKRWMFMKCIHRLLINSVDVYTTVSHDSKMDLLKHKLAPETRLQIIHNGIYLDRFQFNNDWREFNRKDWGVNDSVSVVGTVRSLTPKMGIDHLIRAGHEILKRSSNVKIVIVGDGPLRQSLEEMVYSLGIAENVIFLGQRRDIAAILSAVDIFVMPSVWETFGIAAAEAMAVGLPVVAYDVGGLKEVVVDNVTGILVHDRNPIQLATAIRDLIISPSRRRMFGHQGRRVVGERFGFEATAEKYIKLYDNLLL